MPRVLVVDDEAEVREVLTLYLSKKGYEVKTCKNGAEALDILEGDPGFDLVMIDNRMPGMRGIEVIETIKCRGFEAPVILLTGSVGSEEQSSPADMLLRKPIDLTELIDDVNKLIAE